MKPKAPIDILLDRVEYTEVLKPENAGELYATHSGILHIGEISLKVWVLNDGQRLIDSNDLENLFPGWQEMLPGKVPVNLKSA